MNVLAQPSYTETFNNVVAADGIAEGVPSVVGSSIEWVPNYWQANTDDASDIAQVARRLLTDPRAAGDGYTSLKNYVTNGLTAWRQFLATGVLV